MLFISVLTLYLHKSPFFFFFNDTATTEIYTLSLHDALPISVIDISQATDGLTRQPHSTPCERVNEMSPDGTTSWFELVLWQSKANEEVVPSGLISLTRSRSEEHTSELQSHLNLVCRLLLEKK